MIGVAGVSRSRIKKRRKKPQHVPVPKRLTTAQRWKWSFIVLFLYGVMAFPYAMELMMHPDPVRSVVFVLITVFGVVVFKSQLNEH